MTKPGGGTADANGSPGKGGSAARPPGRQQPQRQTKSQRSGSKKR